MNNSRLQKSEEARRQAMAVALEVKQREVAALKERAAMFAVETQKVETLRALRLARDAVVKARQKPAKAPVAWKDLAA